MDTNTLRKIGMEPVIKLTESKAETFFYRGIHKRIISHAIVSERRMNDIHGPLLYAVSDPENRVRYLGKWQTATPLKQRWIRHGNIHHHEGSRNHYLQTLDSGKGPLTVWSVTVRELKASLPLRFRDLPEKWLCQNLEGLWLARWRSTLDWNHRTEIFDPTFTDDGLVEL